MARHRPWRKRQSVPVHAATAAASNPVSVYAVKNNRDAPSARQANAAGMLIQDSVSLSRPVAYDRNMDLIAVVTPGAQSLATAILTDSWNQARTALARLWAHRRSTAPAPDLAALERAGAELDIARNQAITVAGNGPESEQASRMELFWIGYLAGQLAAHPELSEAVQALPEVLGAGLAPAALSGTVNNKTISGTVHGSAIQAGDVSGGINIGR